MEQAAPHIPEPRSPGLFAGWRAARLGRALLDLVFPNRCAACGLDLAGGELFCPQCSSGVALVTGPLCSCCGVSLEPGARPGLCPACRRRKPAFSRARAAAWYQGPLGTALRRFKYNRRWRLGPHLARLLAEAAPPDMLEQVDMVVPVPLHRWRLARRGFNQALVLSRPLCREHGIACRPELLVRRRYTRPQVGLDNTSRRRNVAGAFAVPRARMRALRGARVLLVDDVFTTGATLSECAATLLAAGADRVDALTLVRAGGPPEDGGDQ